MIVMKWFYGIFSSTSCTYNAYVILQWFDIMVQQLCIQVYKIYIYGMKNRRNVSATCRLSVLDVNVYMGREGGRKGKRVNECQSDHEGS